MYNFKFQEVMGFLLGPELYEDRLGVCYPCLDVYENSEMLCIEVELPGIDPAEVEVEVLGQTLRISGMKNDPLGNREVRYIRMERGFGRFTRELQIPDRFDLNRVEARFIDGVLQVKIARTENKIEMVKRIEIE